MYLAPLNYDRYFKKIFGVEKIAKRFLEDALGVPITEFSVLPREHKITDAARGIEFDFRCKIDNHYVVIEMQQWYKTDIIQRFHLYHCLNTALQLENLPTKIIDVIDDSEKEIRDYSLLQPVITIVWLVHHNLKETDDYLTLTPIDEKVLGFIRDSSLWTNASLEQLKAHREVLLKKINNNANGLLWMQENKEIFFFQKNIVKNIHNSAYRRWFVFAEKTLKNSNTKEDFDEYTKDVIFREMIRRLKVDKKDTEDINYINTYDENKEKSQRFINGITKEALINSQVELDNERDLKEKAILLAEEERRQKELAETNAKEKEQKIANMILKRYHKGKSVSDISDDLELDEDEIKKIIESFIKK